MKKIIYISVLFIVSVGTSCKKSFLEIVPKGKQVAQTTNDYDLLMNNPGLYVQSFAGGWQPITFMGDDVAAENSYFTNASLPSQRAFRWNDDLFIDGTGGTSDRDFTDQNFLQNLYLLNKVINEVQGSTGGSDQKKNALQAEAMAERAFTYFTFINFYGKPYLASSAKTDPGFPIIKQADITQSSFTRNTVQEVYDFMISDLSAAIASLPLDNARGRSRWSRPAAEGFLGKIYLWMGDSANALKQFNAAFQDIAAQSSPAKLYNYNVEFAAGGKFLPISSYNGPNNSPGSNYTDFTESVIARIFYDGPYSGNGFGSDFMVLSQQSRALFGSSDLRLNFYAAQFPYGTPNPSGRLSKYSEQYARYGLQLPELYLLRAEAEVRLNNLPAAIADIEILRKARMPAADATVPAAASASQLALLNFIFDERVREFATEGYRFLDMRRLSVDPLLRPATYTHILYNDKGYVNVTTFTLKQPERLTLRLTPYITNQNPRLQNNP